MKRLENENDIDYYSRLIAIIKKEKNRGLTYLAIAPLLIIACMVGIYLQKKLNGE